MNGSKNFTRPHCGEMMFGEMMNLNNYTRSVVVEEMSWRVHAYTRSNGGNFFDFFWDDETEPKAKKFRSEKTANAWAEQNGKPKAIPYS